MAAGITYRINMKFALSESRAKFTWVMPSNGNLGEANGRCYDPIVSGFLSVDAYLQDPTSAQGFNRYAYCAYNPLRYTDPTGWSMRYDSEIDPPRNPDDPPGYTWTGEDNNVIDYSKDDSLPEITINSNGTWSIPSVPDGHSGTPASQSGPYYQPAPNLGNGSSGGHGTGGNIGGGNSHSNNMMNVNNKRAETITHSKSSSIATAALPVTLTCVAVDGPAPYGDVVGAVVGISMLAASGIVWIGEEIVDLYENLNGKNEQHGDNGRAIGKAESQIGELENQLKNAKNKKEQNEIKWKMKRIRENAQRKKKGENHSRGNKR